VVDQARAYLRERALTAGGGDTVTNVEVRTGDIYALDVPDGSFDVVHAHQVLQHVPDPVGALREMRRVCAPGGAVAARDADYAAMTWFPQVPGLDEWLALYRTAARHSGGEPDAGRRLLSWARAAGFQDVEASASVWCYATPDARQWWGGLWADRIVDSAIAEQAVTTGLATLADLERISDGWREWADAQDGWFTVVHGEVLCRN
jgi:SAM-dependent methyltransferase